MNYVLAVYTEHTYRESHLPAIDNSNYVFLVRAEEFLLNKDLQISMEVLDGQWRFLPSSDYQLYSEDGKLTEYTLTDGDFLRLETRDGEMVAIMVWERPSLLKPFMKYRCREESPITIGRDSSCDIRLPEQQLFSARHAIIQFYGGGARLVDQSVNGIYLNNRRVEQEANLSFGDVINIYGASIVYLGSILAISGSGREFNLNVTDELRLTDEELDPGGNTILVQRDAVLANKIVHPAPRVLAKVYDEPEVIENVPNKREGDKKPAWMSILPSMTMMLPMMLGYGIMARGSFPVGLIIAGGSAVVGVTWATINLRFNRKQLRLEETTRRDRYGKYLVQKADEIREKFEHNQNALLQMYPSASECVQYTEDSPALWGRRASQSDALFCRLGLGDRPFQVQINAPKRDFSMVDDELSERPMNIARSYQTLHDVPLGVDLRDYSLVGVLGGEDSDRALDLMRVLAVQIAACNSYTDVKICAIYDGKGSNADQWSYLRWLPHVWNQDRSMRFIASNESEGNDVFYSLAEILRRREELAAAPGSLNGERPHPHYILFLEKPELLTSQAVLRYLYQNGKDLGISAVMLSDTFEHLPSACDFIIQNDEHFQGMYAIVAEGIDRHPIQFDTIAKEAAENQARLLSGLRMQEMEQSSDIPNSLSFFEMYNVSRPDEIPVLDNWRKSRTYDTIRALIGQQAGGSPCYLDIHEKHHGPHGLCAGTTGSGKSETLQTYILSLAVNYSPLDIGFFIIDYKGGGMANLFSNLPHMMGKITNLSGNQIRRAMVSIRSENQRRQRLFSEFGVNHIDAYTRLLKKKEATVPIPHLLIIIDEFAELKRENPEFVQNLISVAQVGRSLGVHLILATQKPGGTVDDNIRSNSKFKLCLRVADRQDSQDVIHKPDAAYLTQAGRCYLQVGSGGSDEVFDLFQSGWSGAVYDPEDKVGQNDVATLLDLPGRAALVGSLGKARRKERSRLRWMTQLVSCVRQCAEESGESVAEIAQNAEHRGRLIQNVVRQMETLGVEFVASQYNLRRVEEMLELGGWDNQTDEESLAKQLMRTFELGGRKLPEIKEKTQLEAVVDYLSELAEKHGYQNDLNLWLPVLPERMTLDELDGYQGSVFFDGSWPVHRDGFSLTAHIGLVDEPENQVQYPMIVDFTIRGHLLVAGGVSTGKSTFVQTLVYSLLDAYTPEELNIYGIDFSSRMLLPFEGAPQVGGIVCEGEDDRLRKLFHLLRTMIARRKNIFRGGSFTQFVRQKGMAAPAIIVIIDGYANFRAKTENIYEDNLMELAREGEGYGIYLVISCGGFGGAELQMKLSDYMKQSVCLEMSDKYKYSEILHDSHFDFLPEADIKGRGLTKIDGSVLEFQTALAVSADNDYSRGEAIEAKCLKFARAWSGEGAVKIPEIPAEPMWEDISNHSTYHRLLAEDILPVAYRQVDASLYGIDLAKTFCYLILGRERSGKSTFLRNVACAAKDRGGSLILIDSPESTEQQTAEFCEMRYINDMKTLREFVIELITETNIRGPYCKELQKKGMEEYEIFEKMKRFEPVYIFVSDYAWFIEALYSYYEDKAPMNVQVENILNKGRLLNIFFFATTGRDKLVTVAGRQANLYFQKEKAGAVLGGELSKQSLLSIQNVKYAEQNRQLRPGFGYVQSREDGQNVELIVFPQNRAKIKPKENTTREELS